MKINFKKLITIIIITFVIGSLFSFIIMKNTDIYKSLQKPINVPSIVFPIVWSILYLLMSIALYIVTNTNNINKDKAIKIYAAQLIVNSIWTLIFFGFKLYLFAFIWLLLLLVFIIIMIYIFYKIKKVTLYLLLPYLIWVIFAGYLNFEIYLLNR